MRQTTFLGSQVHIRRSRDPGMVDENNSDYKTLRVCCWCVALALGAADAWAARFTMFPDGVAYLDVGDAFWHGDWHNAISAYWSPLYPWVLGIFVGTVKPSAYWEYPLVHFVNFLIYLATLGCFEFFFRIFMKRQKEGERSLRSEIALPVWAWYVAGYSAFVSASLLLITVRFVSGDMLVAAIIYLAAALILKIRSGRATAITFACLGFLLGIGYLAKAVMFLMSLAFLAVAAAAHWVALRESADFGLAVPPGSHGPTLKARIGPVVVAVVTFVVTAGPFLLALSKEKRRLTFGDSGKINYEMNVNRVQFFIPEGEEAKHPVRRLSALPDAFEYARPIGGTYPLWFDPTYWHEGIKPHFSVLQQLRMLGLSALTCAWISFNLFLGLGVTTAILVLYLLSPSISECLANARSNWELGLLVASGIGLYSLVVIEPRYVGALFCLLWIVALSGVRLPSSQMSRRVVAGVVFGMGAVTCLSSGWQTERAFRGLDIADKHIATPICFRLAGILHSRGIQPGDKIAVIATWLVPDQEASYIARLARVQIVAEARPQGFWTADAVTRCRFSAELADVGVKAILAYRPPRTNVGWEQLAGTDYYLSFLPRSDIRCD